MLIFICSGDDVFVVDGLDALVAFQTGGMASRRELESWLRRRGQPLPEWVAQPDRVFTVDGEVVAVDRPEGERAPTAVLTGIRDDAALQAALDRRAAAIGVPADDRVAFAAELQRRARREPGIVKLLLLGLIGRRPSRA